MANDVGPRASSLAISANERKGKFMPNFVILISFTSDGIKAIKKGPDRLQTAKERFQESGAKIKSFYLTSGRYDAVAIVEAPDQITLARLLIEDAQMGTTRTETLFALSETEYGDLVASLS